MPTINQLTKGIRKPKKRRCRLTRWLMGCPQKKASIVKLRTMTPRKPNSAIRRIAKVRITSTGKKVLAFITGKGHNLQAHSTVLLRGGRANDLPGIHYKMIRGKYDFLAKEDFPRAQKRSRFSLKKPPETKKRAIRERKLAYAAAKGAERAKNRETKQLKDIAGFNEMIRVFPKTHVLLKARFDDYISKFGSMEDHAIQTKKDFQERKKQQYKIG